MLEEINHYLFFQINQFATKSSTLDLLAIQAAEYLQYLTILTFAALLLFGKRPIKFIALLSLYTFILARVINYSIQKIYYHPRPFMDELGTNILAHSAKTSFPSNHTTFMLSVAFILLYFKETRTIGVILSLTGLISGFSRVYCGVHYPFDIIGSIFVSIVASLIIYKYRDLFSALHTSVTKVFKK